MNNRRNMLFGLVTLCVVLTINVAVARPWDPLIDAAPNLVALYDASDESTITFASGVNVRQWDDKSANGYHMSNTGNQPDYLTNTINGLAVLHYSGTTDQLYTNLVTGVDVTQLTHVAVGTGATGDWPAYGYVGSTNNTDTLDHRHQSGTTDGRVATSWKIDGTAVSPTTANFVELAEYVPCISIAYYDGADVVSRVNGGSITVTNASAPDGATFTIERIQCGRQSNTPRNYQGELIILNTADMDTIELVEGYLAWKWGTVDKLPSNHPYKNAAPDVPPAGTVITIK